MTAMAIVDVNDIACCASLMEAIGRLDGASLQDALTDILNQFMQRRTGYYLPSLSQDGWDLIADIECNGTNFGHYLLPGLPEIFDEAERERLSSFAMLTGRFLQARQEERNRTRDINRTEAKLEQQTQILNQMHESVITMDQAGFIISWNQGAEQLFGYQASEAIGRNVLFLYEDENEEDEWLRDSFLEQGGREMEVRRRKKSGEAFWASLSLSVMRDQNGHPAGLIGYLNDITERKNTENLIHQLAYYDALTGLPNRTLFMRTVDTALQEVAQNEHYGCIMFIDLNRFKPINDTLGHVAGDMMLVEVASRLRKVVRDEDVVARLGADEFAIALFGIDEDYHAGFIAQKILALFSEPYFINGHELRVSASLGISMYPRDATDTATLLRLADIAMYRAKQNDNNGGYAYYNEEMNRNALESLRTETGLLRAIEHNELLLHYQPKVSLSTDRITGVEALVRWQHPERGLLQPFDFIHIAEQTGLIAQLGEWVLEAACQQADDWKKAGLPPLRIAINVTAREFTRALPDNLRAALQRHGLQGDWLELELTESTLMQRTDHVIAIMEKICRLGVTISLDDFGTGYSSLSYLKRFPIHTLKIDRSFTTGIPDDSNDCAIGGAIIGIAKQLKLKVIAEGVENRQQLAYLKAAGCDEMQGYLFSKPVPALEIEQLLREQDALP
ncbi:EAL domain-containing protein [Herbaspirillum sp. RTI4]|uniref:putative bifunctional diguanylate cyclase/phosphodiesterase n=1 Tax=Herbaspirillum sp. RTI4 TaxID=3048640 RepID=UPI002AB47A06|nr:EAL domain-containing protein [Herbaspirillum sp. RTI4]MDY7579251.1 EAL domain-containing protein [Herbaspirillum sp. RTI4]MEA9982750.1 EAL domain-containing protein [Herbaspirillum sp. RTI4]